MNPSQTRRPNKRRKYGPKETSHSRPKPPTATSKRLEDDTEKDDDERRLESLLFGTPLLSSTVKGKQKVLDTAENPVAENTGLDHLANSELFVADFPEDEVLVPLKSISEGEETESRSSSASSSDNETDAEAEPPSSNPATSEKPATWFTSRASSSKNSAWLDSSDATVTISLKDDKRLRKLRDAPEDDQIGGPQYEVKLREHDRRLRLFNIDGLTNPILQTVHTPNLPITNAQFHPSGQSILLSGARPYFVTYDLQSGTTTESPRGLWSSSSVTEDGKAQGDRSMEIAKFSDDGKLLAVGGRGGYVHLLQCGTGGSGASAQVITSLKMNRPLKDLEWCASSTGSRVLGEAGGSGRVELMTMSNEGQVYIWDVGTRRCVRTWTDESMYGASKVARGGAGKYFAFGSKTGIVNVYGDGAGSSQSSSTSETPLKAIQNLVNPITSVRFDPSCQIMAIASKYKPGQLRMVHLPSLTVFSNWPTSSTPLGVVMSVDFSAGSEYFAVGNNRGRVLLYNLKHFGTR
ncbi:hypothetical protein FRC01_002648 [Tulasnella sp. 417]|nr:hypothetical protein FRC01_002648 [Tulasnella sp. 417]